MDYGTTVAVTGKSGGWYQVRYDGIEGYLSGEYLDLRTSGLTGYGQVTADALNLRSGAGTGYETVTSLPNGAWVSVSGFEDGWFYVDYDGVSGYVSGDYLELSASRPQAGGNTSSDTGSSGGSGDLPSGRRRRNGFRLCVGSGGAGPVLSGGALRLWRGVFQRL